MLAHQMAAAHRMSMRFMRRAEQELRRQDDRTAVENAVCCASASNKELRDHPQAQALDHAEWLALLLDREATERKDRRLKTRLRAARLRFVQACAEDVDFTATRGLDRRLFQELTTCQWLRGHHNLIITGACGTGKTWLACCREHTI